MSRVGFALIGILLSGVLPIRAAQAQGWPAIFDPNQLLTLNLVMTPADWDTVRHDLTFDIEVPALFSKGAESAILISVRRKSAFALPSENDPQKVALKLDINQYVPGQKWHDLNKVSLESGDDQDPVAEGLVWNLHRMAGGPEGYGYDAALANWAKVYVNGDYIGLYVNVEQRDKQFLKNHGLYTKNEVWLYKVHRIGLFEFEQGDFFNPISPTTEALCYLPFGIDDILSPLYLPGGPCPAPDPYTVGLQLPGYINMQAMLTMGAVNALAANPDALLSHGGNTFMLDFLDGRPRMYFPWDLDSILVSTDFDIYERKKGRKRKSTPTQYQEMILGHPTFRAQYNSIMLNLLNGPLSVANIHAFLDQAEPRLTEALELDPNNNLSNLGGGGVAGYFDLLRQLIVDRDANVRQQLIAGQAPICGDTVCDPGEDRCICAADCGLPPVSEVVDLTCQDGADNDCDTLTDCNDLDCDGQPACATPACDNNGICDPGENCIICPNDCESFSRGGPSSRFCCGDFVQQPAEGDGSICDGNF